MAQKRMFDRQVTESDAFLELKPDEQWLYFHLVLNADDEGFFDAPKKIMRMIGAGVKSFQKLSVDGFIIDFDSGVMLIKHWFMHNSQRKDRRKPTVHIEEKSLVEIINNQYVMKDVNQVSTKCPRSIVEYSIVKSSITSSDSSKDINTDNGSCFPFEEAWIAYGRKGSKKVSKDRWSKISEITKAKVKIHLPKYVASKDDKKYLKDFERYISHELWNSAIISDSKSAIAKPETDKREIIFLNEMVDSDKISHGKANSFLVNGVGLDFKTKKMYQEWLKTHKGKP